MLDVAAEDLRLSGERVGDKEAGELAGKDRINFLRDLGSRPDFPAPVTRVAIGQLWLSRDVERYLTEHSSASDLPTGRPAAQRAAGEEEPTRIP